MKKKYFLVIVLGGVLSSNAQEGKVGINTETPQETLEVKGTLRVTELPTSAGKIYGSATATTRNTAFTPAKMVVANANGVLGVQDFPTIPTVPSYAGSVSVLLENNKFVRAALTGDVTADKDKNETKVVKIQGRDVVNTAPTIGQSLKWNGSAWAPANDSNDNTNIYSNNGILSSARTVTMGNNSLTFSGNNTSFVRNGEAVSVKGQTDHTYIGYYRANNTMRNAYTGFEYANAPDFTIKNEVTNGKILLKNSVVVDGANSTLQIGNIPNGVSTDDILVADGLGNVKKRAMSSIQDELKRVTVQKVDANTNLDLSRMPSDQLKDTYVIDKSKVTLPSCGVDYYGKVISFYKWGGANGLIEFTTPSTTGGMYNPTTTLGFRFPSGISYSSNTININVTSSNIQSLGFRTYKFICIEGNNQWFLDFGF